MKKTCLFAIVWFVFRLIFDSCEDSLAWAFGLSQGQATILHWSLIAGVVVVGAMSIALGDKSLLTTLTVVVIVLSVEFLITLLQKPQLAPALVLPMCAFIWTLLEVKNLNTKHSPPSRQQ